MPMRYATAFTTLAAMLVFLASRPISVYAVPSGEVHSPNGKIVAKVYIAGEIPRLTYEVRYLGNPLLLPSELKLLLTDGTLLGENVAIVDTAIREITGSFEQFPGKRIHVENHAHELTIHLAQRGDRPRKWSLVVRAYDDGIALRYQFPQQENWQRLDLAKEFTHFQFAPADQAIILPLPGFVTSHESEYVRTPVANIPRNQLIGIPMVIEVPGVAWVALAEANLRNYAGMFLSRADESSTIVTTLSPRIDQPNMAVQAALPCQSPWRVLFVGEHATDLIDSDLPLKLNAPPVIEDTSWIRPGKTTFPWWNGFYEEKLPFESSLNTEFTKYYIDFCAEYGIPVHTLDGENHLAWYGGPIDYQGDDPTTATPSLDLPTVLDYARQKGVGIRVWLHWRAASEHMHRAFPLYRQWGIEGVMIDFMDRNDQEMVAFQHELLRLAADNHLTVNFHGVAAPTGLERTYPHLLNSEAVRSLEYVKWDKMGVSPQHNVIVPFTRMLAGPMDYHQGSFRGVTAAKFRPFDAAPLVVGTPCHALATYIVYQNHLPMVADYPSAYRAQPLTKVLAKIPCTWDDSRAIAGEVGEYVVIARRTGNDWWVGAMTNGDPRDLRIPLDFLGTQMARATVWQDDLTVSFAYRETNRERVSADDDIDVSLSEAGGAVIHLSSVVPPTDSEKGG